MSSTGYVQNRVELWLELPRPGGILQVPLTRASTHFAVNDVPTASALLPLGRDLATRDASPVHALVENFRVRQLARIRARIQTLAASEIEGIEFPLDTPFTVFEGFTTGLGYQRSGSQAFYQINLEHWLGGLGYSSAVSASSHPGNPADLIYSAAMSLGSGEVLHDTAARGHVTGISLANRYFTVESLTKDLWGEAPNLLDPDLLDPGGIRTWLTVLASQDSITDTPAGLAGVLGHSNHEALAVLERFEPLTSEGGYLHGVPIRLALGGLDSLDVVATNIGKAISRETLDSMAGTTLLDKLLSYCNLFLLAIIPLVDRVLLVPFIPGLRTTWRTLGSNRNEQVQWTGAVPRPLRGVGVVLGADFVAGGTIPAAGDDPGLGPYTIGGFFQPPEITQGMILFKTAPFWMNGLPFDRFTVDTAGGGVRPLPSAIDPLDAEARKAAGLESDVLGRVRGDTLTLANRYAEALYALEVFRGREGNVTSALRFDVGPGSTVRVETAPDSFLGEKDLLAEPFFGTVISVGCHFDSEAPSVSSSFRLAHLRSAAENAAPGTSFARHPLWEEAWAGAPLLDPSKP